VSQRLRSIPLYPVALAGAFLLIRYLQSMEPLDVLLRPFLAFVLLALALQLVATVLTRNLLIGGYIGALTLMLLADPPVGLLVLLAGAVPLVLAARQRRRRVERGDWMQLTAVLNVLTLIVLAVTAGQLVQRIGSARPAAQPSTAAASAEAPDIYLIMLDGYPRADTLRDEFGYDNTPFLSSMEDLGFEVAADAHSNYNATILTLVSVLNMAHIRDVIDGAPAPPEDSRVLIRALNEARGLATLRELGYSILTIPSGVPSFSLYGADEVLDTGQINAFDVAVMRAGMLPLILPSLQNTWAHHQMRERVTSSLDRLVEVAATESARPRFMLAHVMSPHPPIVFAADGSPVEGWGCFPQGCDPWHDLYGMDVRDESLGQVVHLNRLVHATVSAMLDRATRPSVVVVFSDHGRRHDLDDRNEMLHSLFMSYTPGHDGLFPSDTTPINMLPRLLGAYGGRDLPLATEESFVLDLRLARQTGYFDLEPWTP
jgi:hypothetical protein